MLFHELIGELLGALEQELAGVRAAEAARRIPLSNGRCLGRAGIDWLYTFGLQYPAVLPDDIPLRIDLPRGGEVASYAGQLIAAGSFELTVATSAPLPDQLARANLVLDSTFILDQLMVRLGELREHDCDLAMALFGFRPPRLQRRAPRIDCVEANEFQVEALRAAIERDVTYIWGPPGTGKTTTLAMIAGALASGGQRVLMAAAANVAVDNAVLAVASRLQPSASVVRYGTPHIPALRSGQAELGVRGTLLETMPLPFDTLTSAREQGQLREPGPWQSAMETVRVVPARKLQDGKEEAARLRTLRQARVVGATLSRVALAPELGVPAFDAVLLDEASAASLPAAFLAAAQAQSKVVVLGDPRQLPPVATSEGDLARRWLRRDVFTQAGLDDDDWRAVLLRQQYRMPPGIARLANALIYHGRLIDAPGMTARRGGSRLIDTSGEGARCERLDGSRLNHVHAELAVAQAAELLDGTAGGTSAGVAIITPYRAQARLIWRLVREAKLERSVDVGTVHRFQGLERRAVVFDTVEAPPVRPAPLVGGGAGSEALRLINVAITRAQEDLVVLANVAHLSQTLRRDATLRGLLHLLAEQPGGQAR